ncbi:MAG: threonine--tRNA ligase [Ruminiclostridium sp.]|nr:threonine--tRNA ligase [Ruminiclostridium sp.]
MNNKNAELYKLRHAMAHILAYAVKQMFNDVKFGIGSVIEDGFYYDFELPRAIISEDLELIERKMREIIGMGGDIGCETISAEATKEIFKTQPYKLELINELSQNPTNPDISIYTIGEFQDLCRGPHISSMKDINPEAFKLLRFSGAYWKGDSQNPMLQRIYGTAWQDGKQLKEYLLKIEEAAKRDHRVLGAQLDFFSSSQEIGQGLVLWHPKGAMVRYLLEKFSQSVHIMNGYEWVYSPHIGRSSLWKTSGHLQFYKDSMYNAIEIDDEEYYLKPMNCPFHIMIYNSLLRSYKDLPIRYAEYGTVYRYELSGVLQGLTRVRGFTQDDAHIICTSEQIHNEVVKALKFSLYILESFGMHDFKAYVATKPEKKSIGDDDTWNSAIQCLKDAVVESGLEYEIDDGGGAFYGPKIDLKLMDSLGREWQCSTIQFDFNLPERFGMSYIGADGMKHTPIMVHRALFGSLERFFAMLIEHYNGDFPLWYAPVQIGIVPINSCHTEYAEKLVKKLKVLGMRVKLDSGNEKMKAKIRKMELEKVPVVFVVGDREVSEQGVSVRSRRNGDLGFMTLEDFLVLIKPELDMGIPKYLDD